MSYINSNSTNSKIKFTPFYFSQNNNLFKSKQFQSSSNINNQPTNNNYGDNINSNHQIKYNQPQDFNSYGNISYFQNNNINEKYQINNIYSICYILITKFDKCTKKLLFNFFEQQNLNSRDIKTIGDDKIIIKFQNQMYRNEFINAYNKVRDNFFGVEIKFIDEKEKDRIFNFGANKAIHNIAYNNFINTENNLIQFPQEKSNLQKFLDVFLNL